MLEIRFIRENQDQLRKSLQDRGIKFSLDDFLVLDEKRRLIIKELDELRANQNRINDEISSLLKEKKDPKNKIEEVKKISSKISQIEEEFKKIKQDFEEQLLNIPNIPHSSVPKGGISSNKIVRTWDKPRSFVFKALTHIELAENLDIIDFKRASKITGSNFTLFKGKGALLERALFNFMLDLHTQRHGYLEVFPPFLVNRASMTGTGQLPKLEEDMYRLKDDDLFLIPTAEVPVTNIHRDEVLEEE